MSIQEKIKLILQIMDMEKRVANECEDCPSCKTIKGLKDRIILLSAEVIAQQSKIINSNDSSSLSSDAIKRTPSGNAIN